MVAVATVEAADAKRTICLSAICFTLEGKEPSQNKYVPIFLMWLSQLAVRGGLTESDMLYVYIDTSTKTYLEDHTVFPSLCNAVRCLVKVIIIPKPRTLLEGMIWKYNPCEITQDIFIYCDIDILITGSLHSLCDTLATDTIYVHHEGTMESDDYNAAFTENELILFQPSDPGISAGKFIITSQLLRERFFFKIHETIAQHKGTEFYTVEQPFFNKACKLLASEDGHVNAETLLVPIVSMNGYDYEKGRTVFLDFAGEPGNGDMHQDKMCDAYYLLHCGEL